MKPKRILLIRHGLSEGNSDRNTYATIPDHALALTLKGVEQARQAGREIKELIGGEGLQVYLSPYNRTRMTWQAIQESLGENAITLREDPRLREQDWGHLRATDINEDIIHERDKFSPFYYRIPDGESGADVYDRISTFLESLYRDFEDEDYPANVLIVTHGFSLRIFLMRWFHWSVEEFEDLHNPRNCQIVRLEKASDGHYVLVSELRRRSDESATTLESG
ncbi:MAG: histidine phosphatase family protein [Anaerolineaceae bacterium]|jgi:broad specificity phosphatase PhoE|nr:histidine phosphatase family protein [Anaerolineaceae bacterium]